MTDQRDDSKAPEESQVPGPSPESESVSDTSSETGPESGPDAGPESGSAQDPKPSESAGEAGAAAGEAPKQDGPYRRETKLPMNPRRVRGGVRMKRKEGNPESWAEQRLWRIAEQSADGDTLKEGLEYARGGQTRRVTFDDGKAEASVQGRRTRAYATVVSLPAYTPDQAAEVIKALGEQARYAAKLLAGELPASIEDVFVPLGLHLFPSGADDFEITCTCKEENQPWCKHAVCVTALLGERLAGDPFLIFELRGIPRDHLVEGLRDVRALTTMGPGPQPVYAAHVAGLSDTPADDLELSLHSFWRAPKKSGAPSIPVEPPEVSHPLLRRLGPSPFQESRFPLVGLLATCYELIGRDALDGDEDEPGVGAENEAEGAAEPTPAGESTRAPGDNFCGPII